MRPLGTIWLVALCLLSASNCFNEASVTCLEGTFLEPGGTCVTCDASCATCDGPGNNDCTGCDDNEFRNEHDECRACEASCKSGEYQVATCPDPLFIQCGTCFGSCKACSGPNSDDCTECKEGAFLHATGKCVAFADSGQREG